MIAVGSILYDLVSLYLTPHHEGVHWSLHMVHCILLVLSSISVGGGGVGVDHEAGELLVCLISHILGSKSL